MKAPGASSAEAAIDQPGASHGGQLIQLQTPIPHGSPAPGQQTPNNHPHPLDKGKSPQTGGDEEDNDTHNIALSDSFDPFTFILRHFKLDKMEALAMEKEMPTMGKEALMALLHAGNLFAHSFTRYEVAIAKEQEAIAHAKSRDDEAESYQSVIGQANEKIKALEKALEEQKILHEQQLNMMGREIGQVKIDLAARDDLLAQHEEMITAKNQELETKAKTIADLEQQVVNVAALGKDLTLAGAKQREVGFRLAQDQVRFLAPGLNSGPMGLWKKVTADGLEGPDDPPSPRAQPPPHQVTPYEESESSEDEEKESNGDQNPQGDGNKA